MSLLEPVAGFKAPSRLKPLLARAWRYGLSTSGPVATSGAHFLASFIFLRNLPAAEFGLFSFVLVIVPFCMSMIAAPAAVIPVTRSLGEPLSDIRAGYQCHLPEIPSSAEPAGDALRLWVSDSGQGRAGAREFAGCVRGPPHRTLVRALLRLCPRRHASRRGLGHDVCRDPHRGPVALVPDAPGDAFSGAVVLVLAALAGLLPLGRSYAKLQLEAIRDGRIRDYLPIFRDLTRWSLLGVAFTEATVNAHAYLVTFFAGPGAFALLALGTMLMRPISLVQSALPDLERPVMTRAIAAAGDLKSLARIERDFLAALLAVWTGTMLLAGVLLLWFPQLLLKKGYAAHDVILVTLVTATIMMVRNFRTPLAVKLQAVGEFKALASIGTTSCAMSVLATFAILMAFGPIASLGGIFAGEMVILLAVRRLAKRWMAQHG